MNRAQDELQVAPFGKGWQRRMIGWLASDFEELNRASLGHRSIGDRREKRLFINVAAARRCREQASGRNQIDRHFVKPSISSKCSDDSLLGGRKAGRIDDDQIK